MCTPIIKETSTKYTVHGFKSLKALDLFLPEQLSLIQIKMGRCSILKHNVLYSNHPKNTETLKL